MASDSSLNGNVPSDLNRIVTGQRQDGGGHVVMHSVPPRTDVFKHIPGMVSRLVWATPAAPTLPFSGADPTLDVESFVPALGETRLLVVTFPPDSVFAAADFNGQAAFEENLAVSPGLAERFEPDGMHETPTVDYGIVLDGDLWLELDDAVQTRLKPFDIVVQNGTRHAWRNKSDRSATVAFVLIGARKAVE